MALLTLEPVLETLHDARSGRNPADAGATLTGEVVRRDAPPRDRRRRCRCGVCTQCLDNARWERIFQEKFADPTYYTVRWLRRDSTLS